MTILEPRLAPMLVLLVAAVAIDLYSRRIPNWLVVAGTVLGILGQAWPGSGSGFASALGGLAVGLLAPLPLYLLRGMAAGDVKLIGMVGSYLGPVDTLAAVLLTMVAGGALGLLVAAWGGALRQLFTNLRLILFGTWLRFAGGVAPAPPPVSVGRLPYALAIAAGSIASVLLRQSGFPGA